MINRELKKMVRFFCARMHRKKLAERHWSAERQKQMANKTPLNMPLLNAMHLSCCKTQPSGRWEN